MDSPMNLQSAEAIRDYKQHTLAATREALFANDKGILAMDESNRTCNEHFASVGVAQTETERRNWRELIITTSGLRECISGVILYDETIRQSKVDGTSFIQVLNDAGILIGIKVDKGTKIMADHSPEKVTEGLDGLRERLTEYALMGACFAKWRAVFHIGPNLPSQACIETNCMALANYVSLCYEAGLVPIVEPEILMEGDHTLEQSYAATEHVLRVLFQQLECQNIRLDWMILKPNMILSGLTCATQASIKDISERTLTCLRLSVPRAVGGITFLSGGQKPQLATARLNELEKLCQNSFLPWPISFSFARAIQQPALNLWHGKPANVSAAQRALFHRAQCDQAARRGQYTPAMEKI